MFYRIPVWTKEFLENINKSILQGFVSIHSIWYQKLRQKWKLLIRRIEDNNIFLRCSGTNCNASSTKSPWGSITHTPCPFMISLTISPTINFDFPYPCFPMIWLCFESIFIINTYRYSYRSKIQIFRWPLRFCRYFVQ